MYKESLYLKNMPEQLESLLSYIYCIVTHSQWKFCKWKRMFNQLWYLLGAFK